MRPRPAVPALCPLTLPESWRPLPTAVDDATELFLRAAHAYQDGNFVEAGERFLTVGRLLLNASGPELPDLSGARTVCYFNAVLAALAAEKFGSVNEVLRGVAEQDPACSEAVIELVNRLVPAPRR